MCDDKDKQQNYFLYNTIHIQMLFLRIIILVGWNMLLYQGDINVTLDCQKLFLLCRSWVCGWFKHLIEYAISNWFHNETSWGWFKSKTAQENNFEL